MTPARLPRPLRLAVFGACTATLLWLSLAPSEDLPKITFWDKTEHALAYLLLTLTGLLLFPKHPRLVVAVAITLGAGVEVLQSLMGFGRQGDWRDMVANTLGVAVATGCWMVVRRWRRR